MATTAAELRERLKARIADEELADPRVKTLERWALARPDDELAEASRRAAGGFVTVAMAGEGIVELLPLGLSKATGLSLAARRLGLKAADTIAFGDMPNDIPMFAWASHGVAMANAHEELRAVADEVTSSNEEDGIAAVLERLLP